MSHFKAELELQNLGIVTGSFPLAKLLARLVAREGKGNHTIKVENSSWRLIPPGWLVGASF